MRLVDTHCHLNFDSFDADRAESRQRAQEADVRAIVLPAVDEATSHAVVALANATSSPALFAAVGIHPNSTVNFRQTDLEPIAALAAEPRVVAIGEIGLDYHWDTSPKQKQVEAFEAQLALAAQLEKPVIIHNREASEDVMALLETWVKTLPRSLHGRAGVLHSFSASQTVAERAITAGFYLGFTGPVTYKNADALRHIAATVPLDRILVETDAPYLTPHPYRGKRNEPAYVRLVAERIAALRNMDFNAFAEATTQNAERLFGISVS